MTIMVAGGLTFAIPGMMPEAHAANANLFVSAEKSEFGNTFGGGQVVEIVINDDDIRTLDDAHGQPDVTVNGKQVVMVQATDGNWYAYVADKATAQIADETQDAPNGGTTATFSGGKGLDFGTFCSKATELAYTTGSVSDSLKASDSVGVAVPTVVPLDGTGSGLNGTGTITLCGALPNGNVARPDANTTNNVVRESKSPSNSTTTNKLGQVNLNQQLWPLIQLYEFNPTGNVVIIYNKGGDIQKTTLLFDTADVFSGLSIGRTVYPRSAEINLEVTDMQLNIDPTDEDSWTFTTIAGNQSTYYQLFDENGETDADGTRGAVNIKSSLAGLLFEDNGILKFNNDTQSSGTFVVELDDNDDSILTAEGTGRLGTSSLDHGSLPITLVETDPNSALFVNYDESDDANLNIASDALRGTSATIDYNDTPITILVGFDFADIVMDASGLGGEWNSGEELPVTLFDQDANLNVRADEDLDLNNAAVPLIPSLQIGSPITLDSSSTVTAGGGENLGVVGDSSVQVQSFSQRALINVGHDVVVAAGEGIAFNFTDQDQETLGNFLTDGTNGAIFHFLNYDIRSFDTGDTAGLEGDTIDVYVNDKAVETGLTDFSGLVDISADAIGTGASASDISVTFNFTAGGTISSANYTAVVDFFSFGTDNDGETAGDRYNNAIYRLELEETGDNTGEFIGSVEYIMLNQINVNQSSTYAGIGPISDEIVIIVHEDLTDEDSPRINYLDLGADGVSTQIADQQEAPTHSGVVSFDSDTYKVADTVVVTVDDQDINVDSDLIDIFTTVNPAQSNDEADQVGAKNYGQNTRGENFGRLLDITFDDQRWLKSNIATDAACTTAPSGDDGLFSTGFTLVETGQATGIFTGDFQIPAQYCARSGSSASLASVTGTDIEVNYVDYRDASGEIIEVGDGAGVRANTGSVSLDRTVYPVPWGKLQNFDTDGTGTGSSSASNNAVFPIHLSGITDNVDDATETLGEGPLTIHVRVNDPDFDISAVGEDKIQENQTRGTADNGGPVKITVTRGASELILATAGATTASTSNNNKITVGATVLQTTRELGPITEVSPDSGIFELDFTIRWSDGPASTKCPDAASYTGLNGTSVGSELTRFNTASASDTSYCILQGDILTVEYLDPTDASGDPNTVTDSATFDLRNGVLQSDKSVYIIGGDMILTLIEPDFDLDNDGAETYSLNLIEWDSDAKTTVMGNKATAADAAAFDPEPSDLRETGDSTGIFQIVIEIPESLGGDKLERGEEIVLEYTDWGPSGADFVGDEDEDINLTIFTSNFGATVELDQKVYSWTDKVYITIVAPDHNFDSNLIDEIGNSASDPIKVATRGNNLDSYKLVETGTDTGIFTGEVILTGFTSHDADGDGTTGDAKGTTGTSTGDTASGPTDGFLATDDDDGITVSFEFSEDETVVGSALIRWNIGEVQWLEASYPATGTGVVRVVDPDLNLNPEAVDNFAVDVWSDSDAGGIDLTVTETNEATGIFEGTVFFTTTDESSGHRLRVAEGDTITAEYEDNTLPDPYTTADELDITATSIIGTIVPPLERAPAANARVVDAFGNSLTEVSVDQQVQIQADVSNGQDRDQGFAYIVQIQDESGITVALAWITGTLTAGQSFSPALSWIPDAAGTYTATVFVWESIDNPTALSPTISTTINVV